LAHLLYRRYAKAVSLFETASFPFLLSKKASFIGKGVAFFAKI